MIVLCNIYRDKSRGIELQEEQPLPIVIGAECEYIAMVNIQVQTEEGIFPQEISTERFKASGYEDAFSKCDNEIQKAIKAWQKETEDAIKAAKEEALDEAAPSIITPDQA